MKGMIRFIMSVIAVGIFSTSAMAIGFGLIDLEVTVNPNYLGSYSSTTGTGTAHYDFGVDPTSPYGANFGRVDFEKDIFASISNLSILSGPSGFSLSITDLGTASGVELEGGLIAPGAALRFTVDYTLTDPRAYFLGQDPDHTDPDWKWSQDGTEPWNQSVVALYAGSAGIAIGGGSTSIPEPASLVLLGSGLLGLGFLRKMRS